MGWDDGKPPKLRRCEGCRELFAVGDLTFHLGQRLCDDCLDDGAYELWPDHGFHPRG